MTTLKSGERPVGEIPDRGSRGPTTGLQLPPDSGTKGTDLTPTAGATGGQGESKPGDAAQADRSKWDSWPQDPDALRASVVYFDFDKSVVKRGENTKVKDMADYLKAHPGYMLKLDGHADERGTEDYNRALGERRALSVREMLLNLGISQDSVVTSTYGEDRPAELGHNEAAWAKNRRVEPIVLIPPGGTR